MALYGIVCIWYYNVLYGYIPSKQDGHGWPISMAMFETSEAKLAALPVVHPSWLRPMTHLSNLETSCTAQVTSLANCLSRNSAIHLN